MHNWHRGGGGSEAVVLQTTRLLREKSHDVILKIRDSRRLGNGLHGRILAFLCGIYCPSGRNTLARLIRKYKPDIVHVHEIYPFFSPWSLLECRQSGVPVVMTCHDYRLTCPTAIHLKDGAVCELCADGCEYWCVLKNCRDNIFESLAYALRSFVARKFQLFHNNVSGFIALNEFAKNRLIDASYNEKRISVLPNMVSIPDVQADPSKGEYIGYAGRISSEKGIDTLLSAASKLRKLNVKIAGDGELLQELESVAPNNISFLGHLKRDQMADFYLKARFIVCPSKWFEMCPIVILEAMSYGLPVIASNTGALSQIVEDGITGLLFKSGDGEDLANKMKLLWEKKDLCLKMGQEGRNKAFREYSEDVHYRRLMDIYQSLLY